MQEGRRLSHARHKCDGQAEPDAPGARLTLELNLRHSNRSIVTPSERIVHWPKDQERLSSASKAGFHPGLSTVENDRPGTRLRRGTHSRPKPRPDEGAVVRLRLGDPMLAPELVVFLRRCQCEVDHLGPATLGVGSEARDRPRDGGAAAQAPREDERAASRPRSATNGRAWRSRRTSRSGVR